MKNHPEALKKPLYKSSWLRSLLLVLILGLIIASIWEWKKASTKESLPLRAKESLEDEISIGKAEPEANSQKSKLTTLRENFYAMSNEQKREQEKVQGFSLDIYNSWASLKKDVAQDDASEIFNETQEHADVDTESGKIITEGSVYFVDSHLDGGLYSIDNFEVTAWLSDEEGNDERLEMKKEHSYKNTRNYIFQFDSDRLKPGTYQVCLWALEKEGGQQQVDCQQLTWVSSPLVHQKEYDELGLNYTIKPEGYTVRLGKVDYAYPGLGVERYKTTEDGSYFIVEPAINEWTEAVIINAQTGKVLDKTIQWDSFWKKTHNGYRIYTCGPFIYAENKVVYADLNTSTDQITETSLSDNYDTCRLQEGKMQIINREPEGIYEYFEYDFATDRRVNEVQGIVPEEDESFLYYLEDDESMNEFIEKYVQPKLQTKY